MLSDELFTPLLTLPPPVPHGRDEFEIREKLESGQPVGTEWQRVWELFRSECAGTAFL